MTNMCHQLFLINYFYLGLDNRQGGTPMETFQALKLMFLFGMFILALLTFIQKMK
ncbi:putative holin-like toxin [Paenibacillus larvae]